MVEREEGLRGCAAVVVLGDLARSPRMLAHAEALVGTGWRVLLVGYVENELPGWVARSARVRVQRVADLLGDRAREARHRGRWLVGLVRAVALAVGLVRALLGSRRVRGPAAGAGRADGWRPRVLLLQCPPALPALGAALAVARWLGARLVVDWHNVGADMLSLRLGGSGAAVRLAAALERGLARCADAHLAVTRALAERLALAGTGGVCVLPDLPRRAGAPPARAAARARLGALVELPAGEPLVITSTSWTLDEEPDLLLAALEISRARGGAGARAAYVITGRGGERAGFARRLEARPEIAARVRLAWLAPEDYPVALAGADLGLSLHRSASGVDFPMKIVDMRAAGLPVLALDFGPGLAERFQAGRDGLTFRDAAGLADLLDRLCGEPRALAGMGAPAAAPGWEEAWRETAAPLLR